MKEERAFEVLEVTGEALITHDDRLLIRAQKSDIRLEADWRSQVAVTQENGRPVIVDYWRTGGTASKQSGTD